MFEKPFKSSGIIVIDNIIKSTFLMLVVFVTNITLIINKIKSLNFNINTNITILSLITIYIFAVAILNIIDWNITYIMYKDKKIRVYKNTMTRNMNEFSIENISTIVLDETFIDKLFKVSRIKIYTNNSREYKNEIEVVLKKDKCVKFISRLIYDLGKEIDYELENKRFDFNIKLKNVILHSIFNIPFTQIFVIINAILILFFSINNSSSLKEMLSNLLGVFITVFGILLPVIYNFIKSLVTLYGMKIDKNGDFIHIKYGFITTKNCIIPVRKINGILIKETVLSKLFNYASVSYICPSLTNKKEEIILPMLKRSTINEILTKTIIDEKICEKNDYIYQPKITIKLYLYLILILDSISVLIMILFSIKIVYMLLLCVVSIIIVVYLYYSKRIQILKKYIIIYTGVIIKKTVILKYKDIKYYRIIKDLVNFDKGVCTLKLYISSGIKNRSHSLGYLSNKNASIILKNIY